MCLAHKNETVHKSSSLGYVGLLVDVPVIKTRRSGHYYLLLAQGASEVVCDRLYENLNQSYRATLRVSRA